MDFVVLFLLKPFIMTLIFSLLRLMICQPESCIGGLFATLDLCLYGMDDDPCATKSLLPIYCRLPWSIIFLFFIFV